MIISCSTQKHVRLRIFFFGNNAVYKFASRSAQKQNRNSSFFCKQVCKRSCFFFVNNRINLKRLFFRTTKKTNRTKQNQQFINRFHISSKFIKAGKAFPSDALRCVLPLLHGVSASLRLLDITKLLIFSVLLYNQI